MLEQQLSGRVVVVRLVVATALLFALPISFLIAYALLMLAPSGAVSTHLYVIVTLAAGLAGTRLLVSFLPVSPVFRRLLSAGLLCCVGVGLICLYAASLVGLKYWGRVATVDLASTYAAQAPALLRALGYQPTLMFAASAALVLTGVAVAYGYLLRYDWVPAFRAHISRSTSAVVAAALLSILIVCALALEERDWGRKGEPLSLSLFPEQADMANQSHGINVFRVAQLQREDDIARASYVPTPAGARSNVILIVVDALRADHLSLFGYGRKTSPHLEELRDKGVMSLATSALTVCNESSCGLRALASSRYLDRQSENSVTLHEVMRKHGYRIHLVFSGDHANFYGVGRIYGQVDSYFDGASQGARYINDDRVVTERLATFAPWDGTPTLFQFHLMSTHALGERFPETPEYGPGRNYTGNRWGSSDAEMPRLATNHYDRGVLQTDAVISKLLSQLDERGYLKDALVVITGDHGESLGERGLYSHTHSLWEESLRVPFIVLAFGNANKSSLKPSPAISQVDIAPSVLHMLGLPQPANWEGSPAQGLGQRRYAYFQQAAAIGLLDTTIPEGLYKHWVDTRTGRQHTFNLTTDPGETTDVTDKVLPAVRQEWRSQLVGRSGALAKELQDKLRAPALSH